MDNLAQPARQDRKRGLSSQSRSWQWKHRYGLGFANHIPPEQANNREGVSIFAFIFAGKEHLDIPFLSETQETQLKQVCKPFFSQAG